MSPVIGLLVCDHVAPELRDAASGRDYPEIYTTLLRRAEPALSIVSYNAVGANLPDSPEVCDGWVITGSRYDANGNEPWLVGLHGFIRQLHSSRARTVGVCFGHQAIAHALGGAVGRATGWKAGPQDLQVDSTPWFGPAEVTIHAMHRDAVTALPDGAAAIGQGDTGEHPVFVVDDTMLCIQDHPEFDDVYAAGLVAARRERMGDEVTDTALARIGRVATDGATVATWLVDFLLDRRS